MFTRILFSAYITRALRECRPPPSTDPDDPDSDPDHSQNVITCSLSHLGHFLKISSKSSYLSLKITLIQKIQIVIRITPKMESFLPFTFSDIMKISSKSVHKFLCYLVHKQTDRQTDRRTDNPGENITSLAEVINRDCLESEFIQ